MKHYCKPFLMCCMLLALFTACTSGSDENMEDLVPEAKPIQLTAQQQQMRDSSNKFAFHLFQTINEEIDDGSSIIVSPLSIAYLLGMLNTGADGQTRQQITDVMGLGNSVQEINDYFKKMMDEAPLVDPTVTVHIANCIDANSALGISLIPHYKLDMQLYYNAQIDALDFTKSSSLDIINNWCKNNTDGMIPTILDEISPIAVMYLMNAIYFNASWTEKFDPKDTHEMNFTMPDGSTVQRMLMHSKTLASYGKNELCETLYLPYGSNSYGMYILLPNEGKTVNDVIRNLTPEGIEQQQNGMKKHEVDILLPRFTTSSEVILNNILSAMGMPLAFQPHDAEFPYMAQGINLYVSKMKQRAKIEVSEEGTKAAAVTIAETRNSMAGPQYQKADFHATRPFVYYIIENSTRSIFFIGTYCGD